jgi:4-hydroxybenzoate polyprenyltransferase
MQPISASLWLKTAWPQVASFARFSLLGGTLFYVFVGVVSGARHLKVEPAITALVVATLFHICVYVINDLVDLSIDRTEPRRAKAPLVTGAISSRTALAIACGCGVGAVSVDATTPGHDAARTGALLMAIALLVVYDVIGKRCRWPQLTDLLQGVGWASLVVYGALVAGTIGRESIATALYIGLYVAFVNGVHGGLRDLPNDRAHGVRSTAIVLGATPDVEGGFAPGRTLLLYAIGAQSVLAVVALALPIAELDISVMALTRLALVAAVGVASSIALFTALRPGAGFAQTRTAGGAHMLTTLLIAALIAQHSLSVGPTALAAAILLLPALSERGFRRALIWVAWPTQQALSPDAGVDHERHV